MISHRPLLLVDDDELEAIIVRRTLRKLGVCNELVHKIDGDEALDYLLGDALQLPCAILLDLNMPRMDGFEFLYYLKANPKLRDIPVLMVTTSASEADKKISFELGAENYIVKTLDICRFQEDLKCLGHYCHRINEAESIAQSNTS
jgi:CheY-like chemotaxis protein